MEYHSAMIQIIQMSYTHDTVDTHQPDGLHAPSGKISADLVIRSRVCLETVLRLYYLRHNCEHSDSFLTWFHMSLSNMVAADLQGQYDLTVHRPIPVTDTISPTIPILEILAQLYDEISHREGFSLAAADTNAAARSDGIGES